MVIKKTDAAVRTMLSDTILSLCKNTLPYDTEFSVEALIGITLDSKEIFLVNINETVGKHGQSSGKRKQSRERETDSSSESENEDTSKKRKRRKSGKKSNESPDKKGKRSHSHKKKKSGGGSSGKHGSQQEKDKENKQSETQAKSQEQSHTEGNLSQHNTSVPEMTNEHTADQRGSLCDHSVIAEARPLYSGFVNIKTEPHDQHYENNPLEGTAFPTDILTMPAMSTFELSSPHRNSIGDDNLPGEGSHTFHSQVPESSDAAHPDTTSVVESFFRYNTVANAYRNNRKANGTCPFCHKSYYDLKKHMLNNEEHKKEPLLKAILDAEKKGEISRAERNERILGLKLDGIEMARRTRMDEIVATVQEIEFDGSVDERQYDGQTTGDAEKSEGAVKGLVNKSVSSVSKTTKKTIKTLNGSNRKVQGPMNGSTKKNSGVTKSKNKTGSRKGNTFVKLRIRTPKNKAETREDNLMDGNMNNFHAAEWQPMVVLEKYGNDKSLDSGPALTAIKKENGVRKNQNSPRKDKTHKRCEAKLKHKSDKPRDPKATQPRIILKKFAQAYTKGKQVNKQHHAWTKEETGLVKKRFRKYISGVTKSERPGQEQIEKFQASCNHPVLKKLVWHTIRNKVVYEQKRHRFAKKTKSKK